MLTALLALSMTAFAADAATDDAGNEPWRKDGMGWGGFPFANYSSDDGLGFGALGSIFEYDGKTAPYKAETYFLLYASTTGVQTHRLQHDRLAVGDPRLRITTRFEFAADKSSNYCGTAPPGDCHPANAELAAHDAGLVDNANKDDDAYDQLVGRYYKKREIRPNFSLTGRWALREDGTRIEVFGSYYGEIKRAGDFDARAPWPGSLYEQEYPTGEEGYISLLQVGLMADKRDNEPSPIRGHWDEISVRAAGPWSGSSFSYGGINLSLRGYTPLFTDRVVLADRLVIDEMWGAPPTTELVRSGSTDFYTFFGGQRAGRGVRSGRVMGKSRMMNQIEVRATVAELHPGKATIDLTPVAFLDAGYWADDLSSLDQGALVYGTGAGWRTAINKNFILRADVGFSPLEDWAPKIYLDVKNLW
jgi:hypothetical protein